MKTILQTALLLITLIANIIYVEPSYAMKGNEGDKNPQELKPTTKSTASKIADDDDKVPKVGSWIEGDKKVYDDYIEENDGSRERKRKAQTAGTPLISGDYGGGSGSSVVILTRRAPKNSSSANNENADENADENALNVNSLNMPEVRSWLCRAVSSTSIISSNSPLFNNIVKAISRIKAHEESEGPIDASERREDREVLTKASVWAIEFMQEYVVTVLLNEVSLEQALIALTEISSCYEKVLNQKVVENLLRRIIELTLAEGAKGNSHMVDKTCRTIMDALRNALNANNGVALTIRRMLVSNEKTRR